MRINQGKFHTIRLQHGSQSDIYTQFVGCIIDTCLDIGTMLLNLAIYQSTEHILRIVLIVLNTCRITDSISLRMDQGTDGIQLYSTCYQGIDIHITFKSSQRRSIQVHFYRLEVISHIFDEARDEIIPAGREINMSEREAVTYLNLIDATVLKLLPQFLLQSHHSIKEHLISTMRIHVQAEITTGSNGMGSIPGGQHIQIHSYRTIDIISCSYGNIVQRGPYLMVIL